MARRSATWTSLWATLSAEGSSDLAGLRQAWLRRRVARRMRARRLGTAGEYVRVLESNPAELALAGALRPSIVRREAAAAAGSGPSAPRWRWLELLPVAAVVAEAGPRGRQLRLVASNRLARQLLGSARDALQATGRRWQWLRSDESLCHDRDMPLNQAVRRGVTTRARRMLLRDSSGRLWPLAVDAARLPGHRPVRAIETIQLLPQPASAGEHAFLATASQVLPERLFEGSPVAELLSDPEGVVLQANAQARELFGVGQAGWALAGHLSSGCLAALQEALQSAAVEDVRVGLRLRARPREAFEAHIHRVDAANGMLLHWVLYDVTAHVEAAHLRSDLIDLALHDLRSPLATVEMGVEAAERGIERQEPARARQALTMVAAAARRLERLVDSLLVAGNLEAGQPVLQRSEIKPGEVLSAAAAEAELAVAARKVNLELQLPGDLPAIFADGDVLFRAVMNLLDNAIRFSPPGGRVVLRAARHQGGVAVSVSDQGPGIASELLPRLFDKLAGERPPGSPRGYGLGLRFCRLAAEAHGGRVSVDSTPGQGSTFELWLPARPAG